MSKTKTEIHHWGTTSCLQMGDPAGASLMGGAQQQTFGLNCLHTPNLANPLGQTSVDLHQPFAFDQLALHYKDYEVLSCAYEVIISPGSGAAVSGSRLDAIVAGVYVSTHENAGVGRQMTNVREAIERPESQHKVTYIGGDTDAGVAGGPVLRFAGEVDIMKNLGVHSTGHDKNEGDISANPVDKMFLVPWVGMVNPDHDFIDTDTGFCLGLVVNLTFKVRWSNPKQLTQS